jgi:division protein CdvB (Snf7/Vps24/ESCRT-III family)
MNDVEKLKQISANIKKMEQELEACQKSLKNVDKKFKKIITKV